MFPFEFKMPEGSVGGAMWLILVMMTLVNFLMAVFWIVLGWRAMKAHERLPEVLAAKLSASVPRSGAGSEPSARG